MIGCTGCKKGLLYVAKKVIENTNTKELKLCEKCRKALIKSVNDVFRKPCVGCGGPIDHSYCTKCRKEWES